MSLHTSRSPWQRLPFDSFDCFAVSSRCCLPSIIETVIGLRSSYTRQHVFLTVKRFDFLWYASLLLCSLMVLMLKSFHQTRYLCQRFRPLWIYTTDFIVNKKCVQMGVCTSWIILLIKIFDCFWSPILAVWCWLLVSEFKQHASLSLKL